MAPPTICGPLRWITTGTNPRATRSPSRRCQGRTARRPASPSPPCEVVENSAIGSSVGSFSATDPDAGDTFTYTLVDGDGGADNASFTISGDSLRTAAVFDYEVKNSYSIRVRSTDPGGLSVEKVFTIDGRRCRRARRHDARHRVPEHLRRDADGRGQSARRGDDRLVRVGDRPRARVPDARPTRSTSGRDGPGSRLLRARRPGPRRHLLLPGGRAERRGDRAGQPSTTSRRSRPTPGRSS